LLFDEPLSNLDVALREETREELRELVGRLGLTAVYVTHDQEEAFALCDRISVMSAGHILQTGAPRELYERPAQIFVARFLGRNNLIAARRLSSSDEPTGRFVTIDGGHTLSASVEREPLPPINKNCTLAVRPEYLSISKAGDEEQSISGVNTLRARIQAINFSGATTSLRLDASGLTLEALVLQLSDLSVGDTCLVHLPPERINILRMKDEG
jgi:ABC-type Fe3+/spermidine/putrescine transport system ATPase subunit